MIQVEISQEQLATVCRRHQIRWLAIFGSALRADFSPKSDIDILVEFEPTARISLLDYARIQRELSDLFQRLVDLVTREGLKPLIKQTILESAKVLYAS
jgi:hypothetical protein